MSHARACVENASVTVLQRRDVLAGVIVAVYALATVDALKGGWGRVCIRGRTYE